MDVSLIICTRDRARQLARCLQAVGAIATDRSWEVIVVDNASASVETAAVVKAFAERTSVPVHFVSESRPGLAYGHNSGVRVAHGRYLAFTDDDCYPAPDYISTLSKEFDEDAQLGYLTGRIMLHDPSDLPLAVNESIVPRVFPPRGYVQSGDIQGANMAFRRSVMEEIGGFDPLFGPGALFNAEDIDAAWRASSRGWKGAYCPDVVVRHHHGRKPSEASRIWKSYAIGRGAYNMKLLLSGELLLFARSVYGLRNRSKLSRGMVLWEQMGAAWYAYVRLRIKLVRWAAAADAPSRNVPT